MPETHAYTADRQARLVLAGWKTDALVYSSVGGKIYAERWARRGGFIGLFQSFGWVAATASSLTVEVVFQGLLPGAAPALRAQSDGGPDRHQAEVSYQAFGIGVRVDMVGGSVAPSGAILPNPGPALGPSSVDVRGLLVRGRGLIDGQELVCDEIVVGAFLRS
ncbi:hypothetical protein ACI79C_23320 [Geodermatophilus sp. SYSU D00697]